MPISIFCFLSRLFNIVLENITIEIVKQRMVCLHKVRLLTVNLIILSSPYIGIHSLYLDTSKHILGFPGGSDGKESARNATDTDFISGWGRREQQPSPIFLPGEFHGKRSLVATICEITKGRTQLND